MSRDSGAPFTLLLDSKLNDTTTACPSITLRLVSSAGGREGNAFRTDSTTRANTFLPRGISLLIAFIPLFSCPHSGVEGDRGLFGRDRYLPPSFSSHLLCYQSLSHPMFRCPLVEIFWLQAETTTEMGEMKMGFFGATSYVIGNVIGSGIFIVRLRSRRPKLAVADAILDSALHGLRGSIFAGVVGMCPDRSSRSRSPFPSRNLIQGHYATSSWERVYGRLAVISPIFAM